MLEYNSSLVALMAKMRLDVVRGDYNKMLPPFVKLDEEGFGVRFFWYGYVELGVSQVI